MYEKLAICPCREEKQKDRELREISQIPKSFEDATINSFNVFIYNEDNVDIAKSAKIQAANFVKHFDTFKKAGKGLYLYSSIKGSGKTRLACSIANALMKQHNVKVHFTTTLDLLDNIRKTYGNGSSFSFEEIIDMYKSVDVLVLDDIGVENVTPWAVEKFTQILNERMEKKNVTIFTSNIDVGSLDFKTKNYYKEDFYDNESERIVSRISKMAVEVAMPEENVREYQAEEENREFSKILIGE
ncbi:ATP-binding protein [Virgibacillus halodenitrificans]|uniref:ATP-binding protein n=1 Tax=Virgibacillus halodenitrificans TaxID=1482 RepID=UPI001F08A950|nr:ATP-binding protein [Virgibacillus halodenitrificans]